MDFNEVIEGATLYLPVSVPGALLYFGDGHATQGDGELNGNALETSMDVELRVDVIAKKSIPGPRLESTTHIMAMGLSGSIDDAFRFATDNMAQWLATDYKLTPSEIAQVMGTAAEYKVSEVADRNAGIVVKIAKERLAPITCTVIRTDMHGLNSCSEGFTCFLNRCVSLSWCRSNRGWRVCDSAAKG